MERALVCHIHICAIHLYMYVYIRVYIYVYVYIYKENICIDPGGAETVFLELSQRVVDVYHLLQN